MSVIFCFLTLFLVAYEDAPAAQEAAVDVLRGTLKPTGILPVQVDF